MSLLTDKIEVSQSEEVNIRTLGSIISTIPFFFFFLLEKEGVGLLLGQVYSFSRKCAWALH